MATIQHCRIIDTFYRQATNLHMQMFSSNKNLLVNPITHENMFNLILPGVGDSLVSKWNN